MAKKILIPLVSTLVVSLLLAVSISIYWLVEQMNESDDLRKSLSEAYVEIAENKIDAMDKSPNMADQQATVTIQELEQFICDVKGAFLMERTVEYAAFKELGIDPSRIRPDLKNPLFSQTKYTQLCE